MSLLIDRSWLHDLPLTATEAGVVVDHMRCGQLHEGDCVRFNDGQSSVAALLLLLQGEVTLQLMGNDRAPVALSTSLVEGDLLGVVSTFSGVASPTLVRANGAVEFASLERSALLDLLKSQPTVCAKLLHLFTCEAALRAADFMSRLGVMDRLVRSMQTELSKFNAAANGDDAGGAEIAGDLS